MHADLIFNEKSQTINIRKESEHKLQGQFMLRNILFLILLAIYGKLKFP